MTEQDAAGPPPRLRRYGPREVVTATYRMPLAFPEAWGNPAILALPAAPTDDEVYATLSHFPPYDPCHRALDTITRADKILLIKRLFVPHPMHVAIAQGLVRVIRLGYVGRNPIDPRRWTDLDPRCERLRQETIQLLDEELTLDGFSIIGTSGIGKTNIVKAALSLLPRVIIHHDYRGVPLDDPQLVYVRIDCPEDGDVRSVCTSFIMAVDEVLKPPSPYYREYCRNGNASTSEMVNGMGRIAATHNLGLLVIDEIQVLQEIRNGDPDLLLNFLVRLSNVLKIPVVIIGTAKARALLRGTLRLARRTEGLGDFTWYRIPKDETWETFTSSLWTYGYLRREGPRPPEGNETPTRAYRALTDALYEETQGITDFSVKVFQQAQILAMESGNEILTVDAIHSAARDRVRSARPLLLALRAGDERRLEEIDDIAEIELRPYVQQAATERYGPTRENKAGGQDEDTVPTIQHPVATLVPTATIAAPNEAKVFTAKRGGRRKKGALTGKPGTLTRIVEEGAAANVAPYDSLRQAGYIATADEFLGWEEGA